MSELSEPKRKRQSRSAKSAKAKNPSEHELQDAAYYLWEQEGRPEGRALEHWLLASGQSDKSLPAD
jgi:DUF2934 family protein